MEKNGVPNPAYRLWSLSLMVMVVLMIVGVEVVRMIVVIMVVVMGRGRGFKDSHGGRSGHGGIVAVMMVVKFVLVVVVLAFEMVGMVVIFGVE